MLFSKDKYINKDFYKKNVYSPGIEARRRKRVFSVTSHVNASLSIEAIIGLFATMLIVFSISSMITIINTQHYIQTSLDNVSRKMAQNFYYVETIEEVVKNIDEVDEIVKQLKDFDLPIVDEEVLLGLTKDFVFDNYAHSKFVEEADAKYLNNSYVVNRVSGLDFSASYYDTQTGTIDLVVNYCFKLPFINDSLWQIEDTRRSLVKVWIGRDIEKKSNLVYITKDGDVYHTKEDCPHLNLGISRVKYGELQDKRNMYREIYKNCGTCGKEEYTNEEYIYITEAGNRYHVSLSCGSLTRNVLCLDLSQIKDREECKTCNKE